MQIPTVNFQLDADLSKFKINCYDEIAPVYDEVMGKDFFNITFGMNKSLIQNHLGCIGIIRHLDLACGTGLFLVNLTKELSTVAYGIDCSGNQIKQAKSFANKLGVNIVVQTADISTSQYPDSLDLVTINFDALNHIKSLKDWSTIFLKVYASLKMGGVFLFDINTPKRIMEDWDYPEIIVKQHLTYVQCPLELEEGKDFVRRKTLMQIFSGSDQLINKKSALIEQTSADVKEVMSMLMATGFSTVNIRKIDENLLRTHIFMKNRMFFEAIK